MRILWVTNVPLPEASLLMGDQPNPFGGWLISAANDLSKEKNIDLFIVFPKSGASDVTELKGAQITYYAFPLVNEKKVSENEKNKSIEVILNTVKPDLVHIFGTEYAHTLATVNLCKMKSINSVISIQGLISLCAKHYMASLPNEVQNRFTFRDFIRQDNLKQQQKKFENRGELEIKAIQGVKHIIGRTTWDKACVTQINPNVEYHFCNETLRDEFYNHKWSLEKCEENSIFISQASYPIKGLHFVLEAMPLILSKFPKSKLYIAGPNIIRSSTLKDKLKKSSYAEYIQDLIKKYVLKDKVIFTGLLDEKQMCQRYLKSQVFVCASSIENSPNSLGEAMILGLPCVASHVGGIPDMLRHNEEGFIYQADASYMLAYYVCEIFGNAKLQMLFSKNARKRALETHSRKEINNTLLNIYISIINSNK